MMPKLYWEYREGFVTLQRFFITFFNYKFNLYNIYYNNYLTLNV